MVSFKNLPIRLKLFFPYALVFTLILGLTFSLLFFKIRADLETKIINDLHASTRTIATLVETLVQVSVKNHLRGISEKNQEMVTGIYQDYEDGLSSEADARFRASRLLLSQSVGDKGYIYCINSRGVNIIHPNPDIWGKDMISGRFNAPEFVEQQTTMKTGYLEYDGPGVKEDIQPRALYMSYFEPWDWIISVAAFQDEFVNLVNIDDFKDQIMSLKLGGTGHTFVLNRQGRVLIHPEWTGNVLDLKDADGRPIIREILSKGSGDLVYRWFDKDHGQVCEKRIAFQYIPSLDWIIGSGSDTEEVFASLYDIRNTFGVALILSLLITAVVTLLISSTITRPLTAVIRQFEKGATETVGASQVIPHRMAVDRRDEIGKLGQSFNIFMDRLEAGRDKLMAEIQTRRAAEERLILFEKVFDNASDGIFITDAEGTIENVNKAFTAITGYGMVDVVGENPRVLKSDHHSPSFYEKMWRALVDRGQWAGEIWNRRRTGDVFPELLSINAIRSMDGETRNYVAVFRDISDMKAREEQIRHLAFHDPLTDLPNRSLLKDRLRKAIGTAKRNKDKILLIFLDLDHFKAINDSLGHAVGDQLLKEMARRLIRATREVDTVCRLGGDEFIVMAPNIRDEHGLTTIIRRVHAIFRSDFPLGDKSYPMTGSMGVAVYPDDGEDVDRLIRNADQAMYQAKQAGKNRYHRFGHPVDSNESEG